MLLRRQDRSKGRRPAGGWPAGRLLAAGRLVTGLPTGRGMGPLTPESLIGGAVADKRPAPGMLDERPASQQTTAGKRSADR